MAKSADVKAYEAKLAREAAAKKKGPAKPAAKKGFMANLREGYQKRSNAKIDSAVGKATGGRKR